MYAIIETGGKQYTVKTGDVVRVEKLDAEPESVLTFDALAAYGEGALELGSAVKVSAKVLYMMKDKKIIVYKYKAKKNVRKKAGHRQRLTVLEILSVG